MHPGQHAVVFSHENWPFHLVAIPSILMSVLAQAQDQAARTFLACVVLTADTTVGISLSCIAWAVGLTARASVRCRTRVVAIKRTELHCLGCRFNSKHTSEACCFGCRSNSKDITELHDFVLGVAKRINKKYGSGSYLPIVWVERPVSLYEKIALYSIADVAVVTATRDGMNLVPYEYIVCRQGAPVRL